MAVDISTLVKFDTVHVLFRIGWSAKFVPTRVKLKMVMARHRTNRGDAVTSIVGTVVANDYANRTMDLYVTGTDFANSELRGKSKHPKLQRSTAALTLPYQYIRRIETIVPNPEASNEELYVNPGQVALGAARFNARFYRILVTF